VRTCDAARRDTRRRAPRHDTAPRHHTAAAADRRRRARRPAPARAEKKAKRAEEEEDHFEGDEGLTPLQVEQLLAVLCEETDIAEVELKMGSFKMKVRRSLKAGASAAGPAPAAAAPAAAPAPEAAPAPAAAPSLDLSLASVDEGDESVLLVAAPKVGVLRRGKFFKGKQVGKGPCVEAGDAVKKGQALCYVEQLGTFWPVEAPQAGEVADFVLEEGAAVEYGQGVLEIAPFFGGHIIGDSKYA
jgi:biotin carboxyl carrier protein